MITPTRLGEAPDLKVTRLGFGIFFAASGLIVNFAGAASAASTFHHLTAAQALTALPTGAQVGVVVSKAPKLYHSIIEFPCNKKFPLIGLPTAAVLYSDGKVSQARPEATIWYIDTTVFPSAAAAARARVKLVALALTNCQRSIPGHDTSSRITVLATDTAEHGRWQGVRFTMFTRTTYQGRPYNERAMYTWLQRGNVLLQVVTIAVSLPKHGARQEQARKTVTMAAVANLDRAAS